MWISQICMVFGNHQGFQKPVFSYPEKSVTARHQNNCLPQVQMTITSDKSKTLPFTASVQHVKSNCSVMSAIKWSLS